MTMSSGLIMACTTTLLAVEVPLVTKKVRLAPNARAAYSWASLIGPTGSSSESSPPDVADVSARNPAGPENWGLSWIQCDCRIDLRREIGSAWNTPVGWRE